MKKIKKSVALLSVGLLLISNVSCGKKTTETSLNVAPQAIYSLKTADISMSDDFDDILCLDSFEDTVFVFGKLSDNSYGGYISDKEMINCEGFSFQPVEDETVITAAQVSKDKKAILTYKDDMTYIHVFAANGSEETIIECEEILYDDTNYARLIVVENGYYINVNNEYISFVDKSGTYVGNVDLKGKEIYGLTKNTDNIPAALLSDMNGKTTIALLESTSVSSEQSCSDMSSSIIAACAGIGDFSIAAVFYDAMYGLKGDEWIKLCDFTENDFMTYEVSGLLMTSENSFIVNINKSDGSTLKFMTQRDTSEENQAQAVRIATVTPNDELSYYVRQYNSANDKYKIEIVNYGQSQDYEENIKALKMDIISGSAPDIIPFNANMPIDTFGSKESIFVDLYSMIDNDPDLSREDFVDGFLEGMASDGKLLMITPSFSIKTIECKDKFLNGLTIWNYDQMIKSYSQISENIELSAESKYGSSTSAFCDLINYNSFIDYDKGICNFDNETFIKLMEFFKDNNIGSVNSSGWDSDMIRDHFKNDVLMLNITEVQNFLELYAIEKEYFNEPATIIGYPTENGSVSYVEIEYGYSILANSDVKDGAWDFLKYSFFDDSYYTGTEGSYVFPALDRYIDEQMEDLNELISEAQKENEDAAPMSDERIKEYKTWVRESAKNVVKRDQNVVGILYDELNAYFNDERSAENTANIIQNRISIYLSEQYQ